jgi:hypothetical protein
MIRQSHIDKGKDIIITEGVAEFIIPLLLYRND